MNEGTGLDPGSPAGVRSSLCGRASVWVWVVGALETVFFGFCGGLMALMALMPMDQLRAATHRQQHDQLLAVYPLLGAMAVTLFVLGFVPGVVYLVLGFAVRNGKRMAVDAALLLAVTQGIVFGVILAYNVIAAVIQHSPSALTINTLSVGSLLLLLGWTVRSLWMVRTVDADQFEDADTDPWNEPQP